MRVYHPDAATARGVPVQVAERQFKSITAAYTRLRHPSQTHGHRDMEYHQEIQRRRNLHRGVGVRDFEFRRNAAQAEAKATTLWQRDEGLIFIFSLLVGDIYYTSYGPLITCLQAFFAALYQLASPNPSQVAQQRHKESQKYLSEARSRGKEEGMRRREEIKTWLRDRRDNQAKPSESNGDPSPSQSNPGNIVGFGDAVPLRYSDREFTVSEHDQR